MLGHGAHIDTYKQVNNALGCCYSQMLGWKRFISRFNRIWNHPTYPNSNLASILAPYISKIFMHIENVYERNKKKMIRRLYKNKRTHHFNSSRWIRQLPLKFIRWDTFYEFTYTLILNQTEVKTKHWMTNDNRKSHELLEIMKISEEAMVMVRALR